MWKLPRQGTVHRQSSSTAMPCREKTDAREERPIVAGCWRASSRPGRRHASGRAIRRPFDQVLLWPVTAPRFSCSRRSRSIRTSRSSFFRQDNSRRSRSMRRDDHLVVDRASARRQRDRVGAAVVGRGADRHQAAFLQHGQVAAHRPLVETDHGADARGRDAGFDRKQRHDPPFRDADAEIALIMRGRAVRQLVGDEGDERRNVAVQIERRAVIGVWDFRRRGPARFPGRGTMAHVSNHRCETAMEQ